MSKRPNLLKVKVENTVLAQEAQSPQDWEEEWGTGAGRGGCAGGEQADLALPCLWQGVRCRQVTEAAQEVLWVGERREGLRPHVSLRPLCQGAQLAAWSGGARAEDAQHGAGRGEGGGAVRRLRGGGAGGAPRPQAPLEVLPEGWTQH